MSATTVGSRVSRDRTILIAGMGTSPAVLTETVWALTHQEQPVVPDEIVVITTKSGKESMHKAIMSETPSVWERLKGITGFVHFVRFVFKCGEVVNIPLSSVKSWIFKAPSLSFREAA